jgi:hypothetical protein
MAGGDISSGGMGGLGAVALPLLRAYSSRYGAQTMIKAAQGIQKGAEGMQGVAKAGLAGARQQLATPTTTYDEMKSDPRYGPLLQDPRKAPLNHYLLMQKDEEYRKKFLGNQ